MNQHAQINRSDRRRLRLLPAPTQEATGEYLERWLGGRRSLRPATVRSYEGHIRRHLIPHIGQVPLAHLSVDHLDAMLDALLDQDQDRPLSIATVHRVRATLHCALNSAVERGLIERNPAALIELPAVSKDRASTWSPAELIEFLDAVVDSPLHALFALLGLRGLRRGEALGLRWRNVDLNNREIRIVEQLTFNKGVEVFGPPKSKSGRRLVAIDERLARQLYLHGCQQRLTARNNRWTVEDDTCVFTDEAGSPLKPIWVTRHFNTLVGRHGLRSIRLHDLRHTSASIGLASGETLLEVSRRLGHSSVAITADIYSEISAETAHASAERLAAYLRR